MELVASFVRDWEAEELQQAGIEIGAHTYSHPLLAEIEPDEAVWEMKKSTSMSFFPFYTRVCYNFVSTNKHH